jgi:hypothetical protein
MLKTIQVTKKAPIIAFSLPCDSVLVKRRLCHYNVTNNFKHYNVTNGEMMFRAVKGIAGHGPDDVIKPPSCDSFISSDEMRDKVLLMLFELFKGRYTFKGTAL